MMRTWIRYRLFVGVFLVLTFPWIVTGCSKSTRYQVLNFFFDGVPHPDEPQKKEEGALTKTARAGQPKKAELPPEKPRYKHPPAEGKDDCSFCHGPMNRMGLPAKDMCLKCHEHMKENRPFMHGPAAVDCVACHNPHESETKTLLRKIGNILCFDCHDKEGVKKAEPHTDMKEDELVCLSCHDPHGGKDKFFLK